MKNFKECFKALSLVSVLERFAYYGLQSFFVFYFIQNKNMSEVDVYTTFGLFYGLIFLLSPFVAYVVEKAANVTLLFKISFFGAFIGLLLFLADQHTLHLIGMSLAMISTAFFRIIVPIILGNLCDTNSDECRNTSFRKLYTYQNAGIFITPLVTGLISVYFGWKGAIIFLSFVYLFAGLVLVRFSSFFSQDLQLKDQKHSIIKSIILMLTMGCFVIFFLSYPDLYNYLYISVITMTALTLLYIIFQVEPEKRKGLNVINITMVFLFIFLAFYEQQSSSINIFIFNYIDRDVMGHTIPLNFFQSISPLGVVLFGYVVTILLRSSKFKFINQNIFYKIAIGFMILGIAYYFFFDMANDILTEEHASIYTLVLGLACLALGEVFFLPVLGAVITEHAPNNYKAWYLSLMNLTISSSIYVTSHIGKLTSEDMMINGKEIDIFYKVYGGIVIACLIVGGVNFFLGRRKRQFFENI